MRKICIAFDGFWDGFDIYDNFITRVLRSRFEVQIIEAFDTEEDRRAVQYLFYSLWSKRCLDFDCIRIFYTGENIFPDFNLCDYAIGFEKAKIGDRYIRYPLAYAIYRKDYQKMMRKNESVSADRERDKLFCAMVVSNGRLACDYRTDFFMELSKYRQVDSGGRYLNNINKPEGVEDKLAFLSKYKFSFAFENDAHPGYCTEKIVQSFAAGTVPVYWGDPDVEQYFNPEAFINCNRYDTMDEVIEKIREIDTDPQLYLRMRMQPAIIDTQETMETYDKKFEDWLISMIDREYERAFRRPRFGYVLDYCGNMRKAKELAERNTQNVSIANSAQKLNTKIAYLVDERWKDIKRWLSK